MAASRSADRNVTRGSLKSFNDKLFDWLLWYNTERPHHALGLNTSSDILIK
jgi:transposase InsO family protein